MARDTNDDSARPYNFYELSELDPAFRADPHARLEHMRRHFPVYADPDLHNVRLTRHADARAVMFDPALSRALTSARSDNIVRAMSEVDNALIAERLGKPLSEARQERLNLSILFSDDPDHSRMRGPLLKRFQARVLAFRPQIERIVDAALARIEGRTGFDVIGDFAGYIPVHVIAEILGVADADLDAFKLWSDASLAQFNPFATTAQREARVDAVANLQRYITGLIEQRKLEASDDLVSDMLRDREAGADFSDEELADNLLTLLVAGHITTTDLIGNGIWLLLEHPDQLARLRAEPQLIAGAIEEILRFEPPTSNTARFAPTDGTVAGCPYAAQDSLLPSIAGANRDPEVFPDPDHFDIGRKANRHLTFGGGAHICLGASLARLEGQIAIGKLISRFPNLRLAANGPPNWRATPAFRGLARLDLLV